MQTMIAEKMDQDNEIKKQHQRGPSKGWQKKNIQLDLDEEINLKQFQPKIADLIAMTPSEKQETIGKLKYVMK
jgi:hypothetical protein